MTICNLEWNVALGYKWLYYYLEYTINKLSSKTKLFIIIFKLVQLVEFVQSLF